MYKGFAAAVVLLALAVAYMANSTPKEQIINMAAPAPPVETAVAAVQSPPTAPQEAPPPPPSPEAGFMPAPGADAPSLTFGEAAPAQEHPDSAPAEDQAQDGPSGASPDGARP